MGDYMKEMPEEVIVSEEVLHSMIYNIRGQKVMLDFELAEIYGYTTKRFNEQINNNIERFDEDFRFKITREENKILRSKKSTSSWGGTRYLPYAFTEQGVAMLATVLKTKIASKVSIAIMRAFVTMQRYIGDTNFRLSNIETKIIEHDNSIKLLQQSFDKFGQKQEASAIFFDGQIYDAYSKIKFSSLASIPS